MVVEASVDDVLRRLPDRFGHVGGEISEVPVHRGRALLDEAQGPDQGPRQPLRADPEVPERALGLRSPVPVRRHLDLAHAVPLDARGHGLPLPARMVMTMVVTYGKPYEAAPDRAGRSMGSTA